MCNESRLLEEDKIIILNIANEMRNRVAEGSFSYLNLRHDPVSNMNKLVFRKFSINYTDVFLGKNLKYRYFFISKSWNQTLEEKSASIVSSCPETSSSFISRETSILPGMDGIDYIEIHDSFDPSTYKPSK